MSESRRKLMERAVQAPVTTVLRRRRTGKPITHVRGMEGKVVPLRNGEEFAMKLLRYCPSEINTFRSSTYLHVSDLLGKCVRRIALSEKLDLSIPAGHVMDSMGLTFAQGTAIHEFVKNKFVKGHPDKLYGRWSCLCGNTVTEAMLKNDVPTIACQDCGKVPDHYREVELFDDEYMVVGSPDIMLYIEALEAYYPIEVKSINYEDWKEIVRPKPDHVLQVLFYWHLMLRKGYSVPNQISILYVSKGFIFKTPYKEFVIDVGNELARLDEYIEEAKALKKARAGGSLPRRTMCSSMGCSEAKKCHVAVTCFQHK